MCTYIIQVAHTLRIRSDVQLNYQTKSEVSCSPSPRDRAVLA